MPQITFNIPADKIDRIVTAINTLVPKTDDSFSDSAWAKEVIRQKIVAWVQQHEENEAFKAVSVAYDDSLLS
jgi:hypothetical protein